MRIGVFCTNEYTTPPPKNIIYAPLVVAQQVADGLTDRGHSVTMYAPQGSRAKSAIFTNDIPSLMANKQLVEYTRKNRERAVASYENLALYTLIRHANEGRYDVIHIHPSIRGIFFAGLTKVPVVFTLHDPIIEGKNFFYKRIVPPNVHYVSISSAQRKPSRGLPWAGTVYNGIDTKKFPFGKNPEPHFVSIGRLAAEKGIYEAIMAAKQARVPLKIAGSPNQGPYWERKIKPHLSKTIQYMGLIPYSHVPAFLSRARGFLFPIRWEEPFGLVMIESMACGTPVVAFNRGSVKEVVRHNTTGFVVNTVSEMVAAIRRIDTIKREACVHHVKQHFGIEQMISGYEEIFQRLTRKHAKKKSH